MGVIDAHFFMRVALGIEYNGQDWQGWQSQSSGLTVQDQLENALAKFLGSRPRVICAGRTDAGVHAIQQVVHLDTDLKRAEQSWIRGVNAFLPKSITVMWAKPISEDFHARFSAVERSYYYVLVNQRIRSSHLVNRVGWCFRPLDLSLMKIASEHLLGHHDFSAFRSSQCQAKSPERELLELEISRQHDFYLFKFRANAFLHHMVRNFVGSLITVGMKKKPPLWMSDVLVSKDRALAAPTFMPDGLYLADVRYPDQFAIPVSRGIGSIFPGLS